MNKSIQVAVVALLLAPVVSSAACVTGTMRGTWQLFTGAPPTLSTECTLTLDTNGYVTEGSCRERNINGTFSVGLTGGRFIVSSSCTVTGSIQTTQAVLTIQSSWLDLSRNLLSGVGATASATLGRSPQFGTDSDAVPEKPRFYALALVTIWMER